MYRYIYGSLLFMSLGMIQTLAQEEKTSILLASPHVLPGERAYLTLLLSNSSGVSVAQLDHWIEFPTGKLEYVSSRLGIAADLAKAVLEVEVQEKPASNKEQSEAEGAAEMAEEGAVVLHLSIQSEQPIPDGPLVEVSFNVAHIQPETITFVHRLEAQDPQGEGISDLVFSDGQLEITHQLPDAPPGIFSCFFYMH